MAFGTKTSERLSRLLPQRRKAAVLTDSTAPMFVVQSFGGVLHGGDYSNIYRSQPSVRTVVDFRARNVASLNIKTYLRVENDDRVELDDAPISRLLRSPNPLTSRYRFLHDTVADLGLYDVAFWYKNRNGGVRPVALQRIPVPHMMRRIVYGPNQVPATTEYRHGHTGQIFRREDLVIFSGYSPEGAYENDDGVSPMETLRMTLYEEWEAQANRRSFWKNSARQQGVIERPLDAPEWTDTARERFRSDWEAAMTGDQNAGRTAIIEEGMHWNASSFSPQESEYIQGRQLNFEEVCRAYGINPSLFSGQGTHSNVDAFHRQLYSDTFGPLLSQLEDEIETQLLPEVDNTQPSTGRVYVEFNIAEKVAASYEDTLKVLVTATGVPVVAVNESRARLNLPKIDMPEFDIPVMPQNVIYGGQPAPTIPTAVPQEGGGPPPPGLNPKPVVNEPPPQLPPGKSVVRSGFKKTAPAAALKRQTEAIQQHKVMLQRYFKAQRRAVISAKAAGAPFDMEKWNSKLTAELYTERVKLASATGQRAAGQIRGVYDSARTLPYLAETARIEAEEINASTAADLVASDNPDDVFDVAEGSRAEQLAISTATAIIGFARAEAGKQSTQADGVMRQKTWVVTSQNSRHPELDGETVDMWDDQGNETSFSNGARYPGDYDAGADESAGCTCLMDVVIP